jgi:hypothetical protein
VSPVTSYYWVLAVVGLAVCGVVSLAIAAWLIRELAHTALGKSAPEDVPQVLTALTGLLDKLGLLLPWSRRGRGSPSPDVPRDRTIDDTEPERDLPRGERS